MTCIGQHAWTSVSVDRIPDCEEIAELARQAYLGAAASRRYRSRRRGSLRRDLR